MNRLMAANDSIIEAVQLKQADLQMIGGILSVDENEILNVARECKILALSLTVLERNFHITGDAGYREKFVALKDQNLHSASTASLQELSLALRRQDFGRDSRAVEKSFQDYFTAAEDMFALAEQEKRRTQELNQASDAVKRIADRLAGRASLVVWFSRAVAFVLVGVFIAVGVIGFLLFSMSFIESITKPIQTLSQAMKSIGVGDLTFTIKVDGRDEFAAIMVELRKTQENLKTLLKVVVDNARNISQSSGVLSDISTSMAATSEELTAQSDTVLARGRNIEGNITEISDSAQDMSALFSNLAQTVTAINASLEEVSGLCRHESSLAVKAHQQTQSSRETLNKLSSATQAVNRFIVVIKGITDQTKLLSLNAMIEAAHAGEAGRGFAIVANEVAALALKTENASNEIIRLVENIDKSTLETTHAVETVSTVVEDVSRISENISRKVESQPGALGSITGSVQVASNAAAAIATSVRNAAAHVTEVIDSIKNVNESTAQAAENAKDVKERAVDLAQNVEQMNRIVDHFRIE